ncbi:GNAT family N-acetyltransferase, partial [Pseudomonas syringae group genomosp. 7]|uniref:GNAT family N-acetyltransferase n=1 Tax=Pseudomonas syringae group genomosp. 7 TaxID=251699 RepID=UPI0037707232
RHEGGPVYLVAEDEGSNSIIGSLICLNHQKAFNDPEKGSSLWCLAVDPQCTRPGVGEVLERHLIEHFMSRGLSYQDL